MHELRSKEFNLLFHGIPMNEKSETSEKIIRTFISEKLHFSASNLDRIIFLNVIAFHGKRLPLLHLLLLHHRLHHCCEIRDHERPELYLQPSFPCQTV